MVGWWGCYRPGTYVYKLLVLMRFAKINKFEFFFIYFIYHVTFFFSSTAFFT